MIGDIKAVRLVRFFLFGEIWIGAFVIGEFFN